MFIHVVEVSGTLWRFCRQRCYTLLCQADCEPWWRWWTAIDLWGAGRDVFLKPGNCWKHGFANFPPPRSLCNVFLKDLKVESIFSGFRVVDQVVPIWLEVWMLSTSNTFQSILRLEWRREWREPVESSSSLWADDELGHTKSLDSTKDVTSAKRYQDWYGDRVSSLKQLPPSLAMFKASLHATKASQIRWFHSRDLEM